MFTRNRQFAAGLLFALCSTASAQYAITEYTAATMPWGIAAGPDGNLWFADYPSSIGCITPTGMAVEFPASATSTSHPFGITAGPDGNLWFTEMAGNRIGSITPAGVVTEYSAGLSAGSGPYQIAAGPDGNLWFTEEIGNRIGSITTAGIITEYSNGLSPKSSPNGIVAGPDGNLWFTETNGNKIGSISTSGVITEYSAGLSPGAIGLAGIAAGPDGNLWFTESSRNRIGSITTAGIVTEYSTGLTAASYPNGIAAGADGALWFTEGVAAKIGRITTAGAISEYSIGLTPVRNPTGIAAGPDGAIWFTEASTGRIGRIYRYGPWIPAGGITSAASGIAGPLSPGEIVSIYGTLLGPEKAAVLEVAPAGSVATSIGGATVNFNGYPAPLTYVSSTQINAVVPYQVAGSASVIAQAVYQGVTSNRTVLPTATTAPAIFTQDSSGTGPGAMLNQDNQLNTAANPAPAGSTIQIFMTGEGVTKPAQANGTITVVNTSGSGPITPAPVLSVGVLIGGQPAKLEFAGEAPGLVAGVLQVNAQIPPTASSGANSITVQIGVNVSQSGVTVFVQ